MRYLAYGLSIDSELSLPELLAATETASPADVFIRFGAIDAVKRQSAKQLGPYLWANPTGLWLEVPGVAHFQVENGCDIRIAPSPGVDEDSVRVFLLGSALGALLFQRGYLVLHGNAIQIGDACMICVGPSGAGKSTLAAGFWQRGYPVLADDVVPINAQSQALPGFPRIKLWQDVADQLKIDTQPLRRIRPDMQKFNQPVEAPQPAPLPVRWIYHLNSHLNDDVKLDSVRGMDRFQVLHYNTYRRRYLAGMSLQPEHLRLSSQLASQVRLARLTRPRARFSLDDMVERILQDIAEHA
jgi:hypothetical protein